MLKLIFLGVVSLSCFAAASPSEVVICKGSHWAYKFEFEGQSCLEEQKAIKEIPGTYPKGHVNKLDKVPASNCWRSLAQMQMDAANCCFAKGVSDPTVGCEFKKIRY